MDREKDVITRWLNTELGYLGAHVDLGHFPPGTAIPNIIAVLEFRLEL